MGLVVCPLRRHTTQRVSAIEILTTDLGLLYHLWVRAILFRLKRKPNVSTTSISSAEFGIRDNDSETRVSIILPQLLFATVSCS